MDVMLKTHRERERARIQYEIWWKFGQIYIATVYSMNNTGAKNGWPLAKNLPGISVSLVSI